MDERKRQQRDDEAETEHEHREEQEEEQGEKRDEEEEGQEVEEEVEEERPDPAFHAADMLGRMHKVLHEKVLDVDPGMAEHDRRALELLYMARIGESSTGDRAPAGLRMQYLVEALAYLQPVLAMTRSPLLQSMNLEIQEIRSDVGSLRKDIRQKASEIHNKKRRKQKQEGTEESEHSRDGELAELVAELARKKRARFAHDPRKHPIGIALERMGTDLVALGKIAAEMSAIDRDRHREADAARKAELDVQWEQRGAQLAARLAQFLAGCRSGAADPQLPGAHPALAEAFAPFLGDAPVHPERSGAAGPAESKDELDASRAVALTARVAGVIDELLEGQDALVGGEAPAEGDGGKRGLLGRLFGRKGE